MNAGVPTGTRKRQVALVSRVAVDRLIDDFRRAGRDQAKAVLVARALVAVLHGISPKPSVVCTETLSAASAVEHSAASGAVSDALFAELSFWFFAAAELFEWFRLGAELPEAGLLTDPARIQSPRDQNRMP